MQVGQARQPKWQSERPAWAKASVAWFAVFAVVLSASLVTPASAEGTRRALLIGINVYQELPRLGGAVNDVETVRALLVGRYGFQEQNVRVITDERATRAGILAAFEQLARESAPDDTIYIHYSGHGSQVADQDGDEEDGQDETICPHDARTPGVPDITDDELDRLVGQLDVGWIVMTLDSCHSGTALRDASIEVRTRSVPPDTRTELYGITSRAVVPLPMSEKYLLFTGAASHQSALDGPFAGGRYHGLFTYAFTQTLASAAVDATPRELMEGVESQLVTVRSKLGGRELPEPQLEGPAAFLDRPLLSAQRAHGASASGSSITPRLAFAEVRGERGNRVRLLNGARLGALPGSIWALYPARETLFEPGGAIGRVAVSEQVGADAVANIIEGKSLSARGIRAVLLAPPPAAQEKTRIYLRKVHGKVRRRLERDLESAVSGAFELVDKGQFAEFVVDCNSGWNQGEQECDVLDVQGDRLLTTVRSGLEGLGSEIATVLSRSLVVSSLLALDNPASSIRLEFRARGIQPRKEKARPGGRGIVVSANLAKHQLRFYQPGKPRTPANSLQLELRSTHDCYLTLVDVDSEGRLMQIFPNSYQNLDFYPDGYIRAGEPAVIPDSLALGNKAGFNLNFGPPAGEDMIRAYCATDKSDAESFRSRVSGVTARGDTPIATAVVARSVFAELGRDMSRVATRGLVEIPAESTATNQGQEIVRPSFANSREHPARSNADWTAASIVLEIGE
ncbi:MAG: caspase family protein [Deltaproteobacteria bacterium]|nr:caspase family protein [Deltaproteobacteria bacterium]